MSEEELPREALKPYPGQGRIQLISHAMLVLLAPLLYSLTREAVMLLYDLAESYFISCFSLGFLVYILAYALFLRKGPRFFQLLEHELGHSLVGYFLFRRTAKLVVNADKGWGYTVIGTRSPLVTLAPYFLPLLTIPLLVVKLFTFPEMHGVVDFLIGYSLAFHFVSLYRELTQSQPDIRHAGPIFAIGVILAMNAVLLVITVCVVCGDHTCIVRYFESSLAQTPQYYESAFHATSQAISQVWQKADTLMSVMGSLPQ